MAKKKRIQRLLIGLLLAVSLITIPAIAAEQTVYGNAGMITEAERDPETGDLSNWLTIQAGDMGVRIVSEDNQELIAVDNFGGIYLNGDVYVNQKLLDLDTMGTDSEQNVEVKTPNVANGFFYLLLIASLIMNLWHAVKLKKIEKICIK